MKRLAALAALALALTVWWLGGRSPQRLAEERQEELDRELASGDFLVHPAELLELMNNTSARLAIFDLREENEYNLFHLAGARRIGMEVLSNRSLLQALPAEALVVLVSNGEGRSRQGWKLLRVQHRSRVYLLEGGVNGWLEFFGPARLAENPEKSADCPFDECRRYRFEAALDGRHPESLPDAKLIGGRQFARKVKVQTAQKRRAGSCG